MSLLSLIPTMNTQKGWGEGTSESAKLRRLFRERIVQRVVSAPVSRQTARAQLRDVEYANFRIPGHMRFESKDRPLPRKERRNLARATASRKYKEIAALRDGIEKATKGKVA